MRSIGALSERWEDYFTPGEVLLWQGAPLGDTRVTWGQIGLAAFGMPFLMVGLWLGGVSLWSLLTEKRDLMGAGGALFLAFFSVPFIAAGGAIVIGPHLAARFAPARIRYAVTNKRAYIARRWWKPVLETFPIPPNAPIHLEQGQRGSTVTLDIGERVDSDGDRVVTRATFEMLADGATVYHLLRDVQEGRR